MPVCERSVFLNCPFDAGFEPLFHAAVLTITALGFIPRCSRDTEGQAEVRMDRIARGLRESKYSIHDLSRFRGEGPENLSRFNMPLELGMAVATRYQAYPELRLRHNWVALLPEGFLHLRFISDLAGFDQPTHNGTEAGLVRAICGWLTCQPDYPAPGPSAKAILQANGTLTELITEARAEALGLLTWPAIVRCLERVVSAMPETSR